MFCRSTSRMVRSFIPVVALFAFFVATAKGPAYGQATTAAGTIQGTVTDPSGAVIPSATVTITNQQTGASAKTTSNASGYYTSGPLIPGTYMVTVGHPGFATVQAAFTVQIGNITNGNVHLTVGSTTQVLEVQASDIRVDTQQSEVQGVLTSQQIENLPINGRNFLDLAQLEPGVQLQDGQDFDPTKAGYSSVSFNGVYGRTARLSLDGQDISDETVGTTTLNVTQGSIEEFQVGRSDLDLSNEITSSGSIIVSTKSGTNTVHGMGFYDFRDQRAGFADEPGGVADPFQRNQFGGNLGGPLIKDKLFLFGSSERIKQDAFAPVTLGGAFSSLSGGYDQSFRDAYSATRLDWNAPHGVHVFGRLAYEVNLAASTFGIGYARYANRDNTPAYVGGVDFATGHMTHSFRASFLKFHNRIADDSAGTLTIVPGALVEGNGGLAAGPNLLAPQATFQSDKEERYDGSWVVGRHTIRYGVSINDINGGGFASFFGLGPEIVLNGADVSGNTNDPDPTQYAANYLILGNGFGSFTETPAFGLPAGGQHDWRSGIYGGDSWKVSRQLTVNYGIRWDRDTGRTDSDLAPIPCSDAVTAVMSEVPCTSGNLFDSLVPGLGARVRQPNANFGPQAGFAYDLSGSGKTVIRGGAGIYFENNIFNNVLFDRPGKLKTGLFNAYVGLCGPFGNSMNIPGVGATTSFDGTSIATLCSEPVGQSGPEFVKLEQYYQQKTAAAGAAANPNYIPANLTDNYGDFIYWPNYQTPRAVQMNIGVQRQLWHGAVLSTDYLRNVITHIAQNIDVNHVGAARYFNATAAQNAINTTLAQFGAANIDEAIADGATIASFAANGLDSGNNLLDNGYPASEFGLTPDTGAAFPGMNPLWGNMQVAYPLGRSVYNGLQMNYRQQLRSNSIPGVRGASLEASYAFSRFVSTGGADQFFTPGIYDQDCPTCYIGPSGLDRTHQFSAGGFFQVSHGPMVSFITHIYTSLPSNLSLEKDPSGQPGEIFRTDVNGDGLTGDLVPGTEPGAFMRQYKGNSINRLITQYNSQSADRITPAGETLVSNGLFTEGQLQELGAVTPTIATAPSNQDNNPWLRTFDASLDYPIKMGERFNLEPGFSAFNLFNFGYFGTLSGTLESVSSLGQSAAGTVVQGANTTGGFAARDSLRVANGSGTFQQGAPRELEFTLKLHF